MPHPAVKTAPWLLAFACAPAGTTPTPGDDEAPLPVCDDADDCAVDAACDEELGRCVPSDGNDGPGDAEPLPEDGAPVSLSGPLDRDWYTFGLTSPGQWIRLDLVLDAGTTMGESGGALGVELGGARLRLWDAEGALHAVADLDDPYRIEGVTRSLVAWLPTVGPWTVTVDTDPRAADAQAAAGTLSRAPFVTLTNPSGPTTLPLADGATLYRRGVLLDRPGVAHALDLQFASPAQLEIVAHAGVVGSSLTPVTTLSRAGVTVARQADPSWPRRILDPAAPAGTHRLEVAAPDDGADRTAWTVVVVRAPEPSAPTGLWGDLPFTSLSGPSPTDVTWVSAETARGEAYRELGVDALLTTSSASAAARFATAPDERLTLSCASGVFGSPLTPRAQLDGPTGETLWRSTPADSDAQVVTNLATEAGAHTLILSAASGAGPHARVRCVVAATPFEVEAP